MSQAKIFKHKDTGEEVTLFDTPNLGDNQERAFQRQGFEFDRFAKDDEVAYHPPEAEPLAQPPSVSVADLEAQLRDAKADSKAASEASKARAAKQAKLDKAAQEDADRQTAANEATAAAAQTKSTLDQQAQGESTSDAPAEEDKPHKSLSKMNRGELNALATEKGLNPGDYGTNEELVKALRANE